MDIANRITELRSQSGYSIYKLAKIAGISQTFLREVELGEKQPTVHILEKICSALGKTLLEFFDEEGNDYISLPDSLKPLITQLRDLRPSQISLLKGFINEFHLTNNELKLVSSNASHKNYAHSNHPKIDLLDIFGRKDTTITAAGVPLSLEDRIQILELIKDKLPPDENHDFKNDEVIAASYQGSRFVHIPTPEEAEDIRLAVEQAEQKNKRLKK